MHMVPVHTLSVIIMVMVVLAQSPAKVSTIDSHIVGIEYSGCRDIARNSQGCVENDQVRVEGYLYLILTIRMGT